MIEFCRTTEEFIEKYYQDVKKIIECKYSNAIKFDRTLDDIANSFFCHALRARFVEKFINDHPTKAKFSSYCYMCLHNYLCAFEVNKTERKNNFYNLTVSLDETVIDNSKTRHDFICDTVKESNLDLETVFKMLEDFDNNPKTKYKSKVPLSWLFRSYLEGSTDSELAKELKLTSAAIGSRKRLLREKVEHFFYN